MRKSDGQEVGGKKTYDAAKRTALEKYKAAIHAAEVAYRDELEMALRIYRSTKGSVGVPPAREKGVS